MNRIFGFYVLDPLHTREWVEWFVSKEKMLAVADSYLEDGFEITDYLISHTREEIENYFQNSS